MSNKVQTRYLDDCGSRWVNIIDGKKETISFLPSYDSKPVKRTVKYWMACGNFACPVVNYNKKDEVLMNDIDRDGNYFYIINNDANRSHKYSFNKLSIVAS